MASNSHHHDVPAMDYAEHEKTFSLFASLIKWGTVFSLGFTLVIGAFTSTIPWLFALVVIAAMIVVAAKLF